MLEEVVLVGGGGGGSQADTENSGGGGGAGEIVIYTRLPFPTTFNRDLVITIGAGGTGGDGNTDTNATDGVNTTINDMIAVYGGGGGSGDDRSNAGNCGTTYLSHVSSVSIYRALGDDIDIRYQYGNRSIQTTGDDGKDFHGDGSIFYSGGGQNQ